MEDKIICRVCAAPNDADNNFCRKCGAPLKNAKCPACGCEVEPDDVFCGKCGTRVLGETPVHDAEFGDMPGYAIQPLQAAAIAPKQSQSRPRSSAKSGKGALKGKKDIIRNAFFLLIAVLLFGLSFAPVYTYEFEETGANARISGDVNVCTVDMIGFMLDTAYDWKSNEILDSKLYRDLQKNYEKLNSAFESNDRDTAEKLLPVISKQIAKLTLRSENMAAGIEAEYIVTGLISLAMIFGSAALLIFAVIAFVYSIKNKPLKFGRVRFGYILYLALIVLMLIVTADVMFDVASAVTASAVFAAIAAAAVLLEGMFSRGVKNAGRNAFKPAAAVLCFITLGVMSAPVMKAEFSQYRETADPEYNYTMTYSFDLGNDVLLKFLLSDTEREGVEDMIDDTFENKRKLLQDQIGYLFAGNNYILDSEASDAVFLTVVMRDTHGASQAMSIGYFLYLFAAVAMGAFAALSALSMYKGGIRASKAASAVSVAAILLLILTLAVNVVCICLFNYNIDHYEIPNAEMTVAGGGIAAIIMAVICALMHGAGRISDKKFDNEEEYAAAEPAADNAAAVL